MSQQWVHNQDRAARQRKKADTPLKPEPQPPIGYARLQHLQNIARAQHSSQPNAPLPENVKEDLQEEWWHIVDESMSILTTRLKCSVCASRHECSRSENMSTMLREDMEKADAE